MTNWLRSAKPLLAGLLVLSFVAPVVTPVVCGLTDHESAVKHGAVSVVASSHADVGACHAAGTCGITPVAPRAAVAAAVTEMPIRGEDHGGVAPAFPSRSVPSLSPPPRV